MDPMGNSLNEIVPLQRRKILKKSLGHTIKILSFLVLPTIALFWLLLGDRLTSPDLWNNNELKIVAASCLLVFLLAFNKMLYETLYFATYYYDIDDNNVVIRKGVIVKKEITLPFSKITDVYVDQDIFDVLLFLYDVHISTPTVESGQFAHIDGLSKKGAAEVRKMILDRINRKDD